MLDVDFEWFDPQPEVDFHGLKTLCRQLFDIDAQLFDLSELVELILSQPLLGSTVKVDGNETDPYAFLTVLNLQVHRVCLLPFTWPHTQRTRADLLALRKSPLSSRSAIILQDTHRGHSRHFLRYSPPILQPKSA